MKRFGGLLVGFGLILTLFAAGEARATVASCLSFTGYVYLPGDGQVDAKGIYKNKVIKVRLGTKEIMALLQTLFPGVLTKGQCIEVDPHNDGTTSVRVKDIKTGQTVADINANLSVLFDFSTEFFTGSYNTITDAEKSTILFPVDITVNTPDADFAVDGMSVEQFSATATKTGVNASGRIGSKVFGTGTVLGQAALLEGTVSLTGKETW
jgi:hypothetical protein